MATWVLIIVLNGWGAGQGSGGNAVTTAEFTTQQKCEAAAHAVKSQSKVWAVCSEK